MSTQASSSTFSFNDLGSATDAKLGGMQSPTAQELLKAFMNESAAVPANSSQSAGAAKLYRGRSTAELIPKIQAELGPQAVVTARRSGLEGGIGGFFQRPFVEIEAQQGHAGVDIRDGEAAVPPVPRATVLAPKDRLEEELPVVYEPTTALMSPAPASFAAALEDADLGATPPSPPPSTSSAPSPARKALSAELSAKGFSEAFVRSLLDEAQVHVLPFAPRMALRRAVRIALERRIPKAMPLGGNGASIALIGPGGAGKSTCQSALAARYEHGHLPVTCASIVLEPGEGSLQLLAPQRNAAMAAGTKRARSALAAPREQGIVLLDTPALSPADESGSKTLAQTLDALALDRHVLVLPATMSAAAMARVLRASGPLHPQALAITHVEESDQLGVAIEAACEAGLAPEYLLAASRAEISLTRTDPGALAGTLLP